MPFWQCPQLVDKHGEHSVGGSRTGADIFPVRSAISDCPRFGDCGRLSRFLADETGRGAELRRAFRGPFTHRSWPPLSACVTSSAQTRSVEPDNGPGAYSDRTGNRQPAAGELLFAFYQSLSIALIASTAFFLSFSFPLSEAFLSAGSPSFA